jgi:hypothetical protein
MRLCAKVVATTQQWPTTSARLDVVLLKFTTSENRQAALQGRKGLAGTKLGLDEDLTPVQQACKSKLWPMFKEAKAASKHAF